MLRRCLVPHTTRAGFCQGTTSCVTSASKVPQHSLCHGLSTYDKHPLPLTLIDAPHCGAYIEARGKVKVRVRVRVGACVRLRIKIRVGLRLEGEGVC